MAEASVVLSLHSVAGWELLACHCHLAGSSWAKLAAWTVPVGQHWLDGANIVYTGVSNAYRHKHACNSNDRSKLLMTICDCVHGIWRGM